MRMMMKSITFFFGFVLFFIVNTVFSQCDPDFDFGGMEWGVSPDASSGEQFETAFLNVPYLDVFHIVVPTDASAIDPMFQLPLDSVLLSEIVLTDTLTLEQFSLTDIGLEMVCSNLGGFPSSCSWLAGQQHCATVEGTPTVAGVYHMSINTVAWVTVFGVGVAQPYSFDGYIFEVIGEFTGCMDESACNFNPGATIPDPEACTYPEPNQDCGGYCIDPAACNYVEDPESVSGVSIYSQSFEGFAPGDYVTDSPIWIPWAPGQEGTDGDAQISDEQAHTGENSLHIYANSAAGGPLDVVMLVGLDEGVYTTSWMMYVTDGNSAYYNIQEDVSPGVGWAFDVTFAFTGDLQVVMDGATVGSGVFPVGEWFEVRHDLDLDSDLITLTIAGNVVGSFTFDSPFGGVNFYGWGDGTTLGNWFIDDIEIHDGTEGEDPESCTYPGCQDLEASNYDATAGCAGECLYLTYDCSSIGDEAWTAEGIGLFPDWQQAMHGVEWAGDWVLNIPATIVEPESGVVYGIHHMDWSGFEGLPDWVESASYELGELDASTQHCIVASGTPAAPGLHEMTATGEVFISIFGQPFSIGEQSFSAWLEVVDNPNPIPGCTYANAVNFVSFANDDDGSCLFAGCTDSAAANFNPIATIDDGSCGEACDPAGDSACEADNDGDGIITVSDLLILLGEFGATCE